jgi:hypothetical protein
MSVYYTPAVPPYPTQHFETDYRNFKIKKETDNTLYYLATVEGMDLAPSLSGRFTNLERLKSAIDQHLSATNTSEATAYSPSLPPKPKRGAPSTFDRGKSKKKDPIAEAMADNQSTDLFND